MRTANEMNLLQSGQALLQSSSGNARGSSLQQQRGREPPGLARPPTRREVRPQTSNVDAAFNQLFSQNTAGIQISQQSSAQSGFHRSSTANQERLERTPNFNRQAPLRVGTQTAAANESDLVLNLTSPRLVRTNRVTNTQSQSAAQMRSQNAARLARAIQEADVAEEFLDDVRSRGSFVSNNSVLRSASAPRAQEHLAHPEAQQPDPQPRPRLADIMSNYEDPIENIGEHLLEPPSMPMLLQEDPFIT